MKQLLIVTALALAPLSPVFAWSECGHHVIAAIGFDLLTESEQSELLRILEAHPRYAEDFTPPKKIRNIERWRIGTAGYWPDIARKHPQYNRPTWHYQLASTLTIGSESSVKVPQTPGPCPTSATLDTQELHLAQAVELCRRVLADVSQPLGDRAIALTWIAHLVSSICRVSVWRLVDHDAILAAVIQHSEKFARPTAGRPRFVGLESPGPTQIVDEIAAHLQPRCGDGPNVSRLHCGE